MNHVLCSVAPPASLTPENSTKELIMSLTSILRRRSNGQAGLLLTGSDVPAGMLTERFVFSVSVCEVRPEYNGPAFSRTGVIDTGKFN